MVAILTRWGCCNEKTGPWVAYKQPQCILPSLEAGSLRSGWQEGCVLVRAFSKLQTAGFSLYPHRVENREEAGFLLTFVRVLIPLMRELHPHGPLQPQSPSKDPASSCHYLGVRVSAYESWGDINVYNSCAVGFGSIRQKAGGALVREGCLG